MVLHGRRRWPSIGTSYGHTRACEEHEVSSADSFLGVFIWTPLLLLAAMLWRALLLLAALLWCVLLLLVAW